MKSFRKVLTVHLPSRTGFVNVTPQVEEALRESGIREGLVLVNDDERGLHQDFARFFEQLVPHEPASYRHNDSGEDNADAHIKRQLMGREAVVAVTGGRLDFGTWEQIFYAEWDGRRSKRILIKIVGD